MKRTLLALALVTTPLLAQSSGDKLVARVNGEEITRGDLDQLWSRIPEPMQKKYETVGGKRAFLENYVAKHLLVQEAVKSGFAAKVGAPAELDAEAESALFDQYVRQVIAAPLVTEEEMRKVYQERKRDFVAPEQARIRIIRVMKNDTPEAAKETISKAMVELFAARTTLATTVGAEDLAPAIARKFSEVAARVSDAPSAAEGGELGWVALTTVDPKIAVGARTMKPGSMSGILDTVDSYHIMLVEEHRPAGEESFEGAQVPIREYLMARDAKKVMDAVVRKSAELRAAGSVEIFADNLK